MKALLTKLGSRKLGVTAVVGAVTTAGIVELTCCLLYTSDAADE